MAPSKKETSNYNCQFKANEKSNHSLRDELFENNRF